MRTNALTSGYKILLFIIGLAAFLYGACVFASIRCGTSLVEVGDAEYTVNQACGEPVGYHQVGNGRNGSGDQAYAYYKVGMNTVEIHFIDGKVHTIGGSENRH